MADADVVNAIEVIKRKVAAEQAKVNRLKQAANTLAVTEGLPPVYADADDEPMPGSTFMSIRADQFANHTAPSTAARAYLELRGKQVGAASLDEVYDAMKRGGYSFEAASEADAKAGLRIALGKDMQVHRLPNGTYGLLAWYDKLTRPAPEPEKKRGFRPPADAGTEAVTDQPKGTRGNGGGESS